MYASATLPLECTQELPGRVRAARRTPYQPVHVDNKAVGPGGVAETVGVDHGPADPVTATH